MRGSSQLKYIVLSILFIAASVNFTRTTLEILKSSQRLDDLANEVDALEASKADLETNISYKGTEEFVEETARNDLNLVRPGEKVYVVEGFDLKADNYGLVVENGTAEVLGKFTADRDSNAYQWYRLFFN